jgi:hypothetical protein
MSNETQREKCRNPECNSGTVHICRWVGTDDCCNQSWSYEKCPTCLGTGVVPVEEKLMTMTEFMKDAKTSDPMRDAHEQTTPICNGGIIMDIPAQDYPTLAPTASKVEGETLESVYDDAAIIMGPVCHQMGEIVDAPIDVDHIAGLQAVADHAVREHNQKRISAIVQQAHVHIAEKHSLAEQLSIAQARAEKAEKDAKDLAATFTRAIHLMRFNSTKEAKLICDCKDALHPYNSSKLALHASSKGSK